MMDLAVEINKRLVESDVVIVDFYADWCAPCKALSPHLEAKAKEPGVALIKVNVDEMMDCAREFRVRSVPTILVFGRDKKRDSVVGATPNDIDNLIKSTRERNA